MLTPANVDYYDVKKEVRIIDLCLNRFYVFYYICRTLNIVTNVVVIFTFIGIFEGFSFTYLFNIKNNYTLLLYLSLNLCT